MEKGDRKSRLYFLVGEALLTLSLSASATSLRQLQPLVPIGSVLGCFFCRRRATCFQLETQ